MKKVPFESWLESKFISGIMPETNKDRFEDDFERWISNLEYEDYCRLADEYGKDIAEMTFATATK